MSAAQPQKVLISWKEGTGVQASGSLILDASLSENHGIAAESTDHPVETGANATDNIRVLSQHLSLEGLITNTPLGVPDSYSDGVLGSVQTVRVNGVDFNAFQFNASFDRVREVYGDLIDAIQGAALFSIVTTLANYEDFACVNFSVPRSVELGNSLRFKMDLSSMRFVDTQEVDALPAKIQRIHRGAKTGAEPPAPTATKLRSVAKGLLDRARGG